MISLQAAAASSMQRHKGGLGWGHPMEAPPLHSTCHIGCLSSVDINVDGVQVAYQLQLQVRMAGIWRTIEKVLHCRSR